MRNFLRFLWMTLVLVIVAMASALVTIALAIHGREVAVPDVQGRTPAEARRMSEAQGLSTKVEREYYSSSVPEGRILSQLPASGTIVRRGWEVRLAVSLGPQRVRIPQIVGQSERAARIVLEQRGLQVSSVASVTLPNLVADQVIGQDPPANAVDVEAPKVSFLVAQPDSKEAFVMPSFIGQPLGAVTAAVKNAGFSIGRVVIQSPPPVVSSPMAVGSPPPGFPAGTAVGNKIPVSPAGVSNFPGSIVVSQDPAPGQEILGGASINLDFALRQEAP
jgi:eukaryotic-like serine/threonine-protein kinase